MVRKSDEGEIKKTAIGVMDFPHIEIRTSMNGDDVMYDPDITDKIFVIKGRFKFDM